MLFCGTLQVAGIVEYLPTWVVETRGRAVVAFTVYSIANR